MLGDTPCMVNKIFDVGDISICKMSADNCVLLGDVKFLMLSDLSGDPFSSYPNFCS